MQDKYNIGVMTVNIELMLLGTKRMDRLAKARLLPVSKPRNIHSMSTVNTPILYIHYNNFLAYLMIRLNTKLCLKTLLYYKR